MKNTIFVLVIVFLAITSCKKTEEQLHSVSGYFFIKNKPISDVTVNIDDKIQYNTKTNSQGYFKIGNIPTGQHKLKALKAAEDSSFIEKTVNIDVNSNISLDSIFLPNPVTIENCILDSSSNKVTIIWTKSLAIDFREYKIYSHATSGLDETTGTLEHVATNINDTSVTLQIPNGTKLFFRIFVLNEFGRLGGSNITSIAGININLLLGGDFENNLLFYSFWHTLGDINIIDSIFKSGSHCLLLKSNIDTTNIIWTDNWMNTQQFLVEKNVEYELSFWYKARGLAHMMYPLNFYYYQDNQQFLWTDFGDHELKGVPVANGLLRKLYGVDWTYYSTNFFPNNSTAITFYFTASIEELYIDNLQIKKKIR